MHLVDLPRIFFPCRYCIFYTRYISKKVCLCLFAFKYLIGRLRIARFITRTKGKERNGEKQIAKNYYSSRGAFAIISEYFSRARNIC